MGMGVGMGMRYKMAGVLDWFTSCFGEGEG